MQTCSEPAPQNYRSQNHHIEYANWTLIGLALADVQFEPLRYPQCRARDRVRLPSKRCS